MRTYHQRKKQGQRISHDLEKDGEEALIAGTNGLEALDTMLNSSRRCTHLMKQIENKCLPIISSLFNNEKHEVYGNWTDEILTIINTITCKSKEISNNIWLFLPKIVKGYINGNFKSEERSGDTSFQIICKIICNFVKHAYDKKLGRNIQHLMEGLVQFLETAAKDKEVDLLLRPPSLSLFFARLWRCPAPHLFSLVQASIFRIISFLHPPLCLFLSLFAPFSARQTTRFSSHCHVLSPLRCGQKAFSHSLLAHPSKIATLNRLLGCVL